MKDLPKNPARLWDGKEDGVVTLDGAAMVTAAKARAREQKREKGQRKRPPRS